MITTRFTPVEVIWPSRTHRPCPDSCYHGPRISCQPFPLSRHSAPELRLPGRPRAHVGDDSRAFTVTSLREREWCSSHGDPPTTPPHERTRGRARLVSQA